MADNKHSFDWQNALSETFRELSKQVVEYIPHVLGALALLVVGWIVANILRVIARKVIKAFEGLFVNAAKKKGLYQSSVKSYANLGGNIIFWSVLLFFVAASANMLEWKIFSGMTVSLLSYLPNLLTGLLIIFIGFALSGVVRSAVIGAAASAEVEKADLMSRIAQAIVILTAVVIGVEQLGIDVTFLTTALIVLTAVLLGGASLAFGLGAKCLVANIIGAQTARKYYQIGQLVSIADIQGHILEITPSLIVLDTEGGRATVPAKLVHEQIGKTISDSSEKATKSE